MVEYSIHLFPKVPTNVMLQPPQTPDMHKYSRSLSLIECENHSPTDDPHAKPNGRPEVCPQQNLRLRGRSQNPTFFVPPLLFLSSAQSERNGRRDMSSSGTGRQKDHSFNPSHQHVHYPFWFGGSASCFAAAVTHPLDLSMSSYACTKDAKVM